MNVKLFCTFRYQGLGNCVPMESIEDFVENLGGQNSALKQPWPTLGEGCINFLRQLRCLVRIGFCLQQTELLQGRRTNLS